MSLSAGETLGPYQIVEKIGAGGMGEVYRARDTRLDRDVAIKVSVERFTERFEREAKLIASLNHHNVCSLYDVGPNFLVMELVEGPTLAERISEGPIPVDEALQLASQIVEALQAAHDAGIVHRDLKPGNIKIRNDGTVKVLDFGLAKIGGAVPTTSAPDSPTMGLPATQAGMIVGTASYMSPEQARGKPVDKRADIWAFGAVLYEMITGRRLFQGEDVSETLASVIMKEPSLEAAPPKIKRVLQRCLEKDPKKRLRDISGVGLLLEQEATAPQRVHTQRSRSRLWPALAIASMTLTIVIAVVWYRTRQPVQDLKPLLRMNVDLGPSAVFSSSAINGSNVILSPDGQRLAYISQGRLYVLRLDQTVATELPGTLGVYATFFSPDGQWLAFFTGGQLKKVSVSGGAIVTLCSAPGGRGGTWGEDGNIIAALGTTGVLSRVSESGGTPTPITQLAKGESTHRWPQILPGGNAILFSANSTTSGFDVAAIKVLSLVDGHTKTIQQGGTYGRIIRTAQGHSYLLYVNRSTLFATPFDPDRLEVSSRSVPVVEGVGESPSGSVEMDVALNGTVIYRGVAGGGLLTLQWMRSDGKGERLPVKPGLYGRPSLSPQGDRVAVEVNDTGGSDIYVYDPSRQNLSKLTFGGGFNQSPLWSPDSRYIVYQASGSMSWVRSDGGRASQSLTQSANLQFPWSFTSDGKRLAYLEAGKGGYDLWTLPIDGDAASGIHAGKPEVFLNTDADERSPVFSPDGRWLAYSSNESGTFEIYVRAFPDTGAKWQISNGGGSYPNWSRTANELFFETPDARIMTVAYSVKNDSFMSDNPRPWSPKPLVNLVNSVRNFDLASDGKRIVALMPSDSLEDSASQSHVFFMFNFFDELERRVPAGK